MRYVTTGDVITFHDAEVGPGLADRDLLDSAVMAPQQSAGGEDAYPDLLTKAAVLLRGIAANHAFVDGNKRTAIMALYAFLGLNGYLLGADEGKLLHLVLDVVVDHLTVEEIAAALEPWVVHVPVD